MCIVCERFLLECGSSFVSGGWCECLGSMEFVEWRIKVFDSVRSCNLFARFCEVWSLLMEKLGILFMYACSMKVGTFSEH